MFKSISKLIVHLVNFYDTVITAFLLSLTYTAIPSVSIANSITKLERINKVLCTEAKFSFC